MKMKKSGMEIAWGQMLLWSLGILAAVVVIYILVAPGQALAQGRNALLAVGLGKLPGERPPQFTESPIPAETTAYFKSLVAKVENEIKKGNDKSCLIQLDKPELKDGYFIALRPGSVAIEQKKGSEYVATGKFAAISGFKPCIVARDGANNFYNNHLDGSVNTFKHY